MRRGVALGKLQRVRDQFAEISHAVSGLTAPLRVLPFECPRPDDFLRDLRGALEQNFARWRNQYGGTKSSEAKRLEELADKNRRLKELVLEQAVDNATLKEIAKGNF